MRNDIEKAIKGMENIKEYWTYKPEEVKAATLAIDALKKQMPFINDEQYEIFKAVLNERHRQDGKWGEQNHDLPLWTGILGEEYGELCEAINETVFDNGINKGGYENMKKEAIHVAAVAIGFLECLERNKHHWFPERR